MKAFCNKAMSVAIVCQTKKEINLLKDAISLVATDFMINCTAAPDLSDFVFSEVDNDNGGAVFIPWRYSCFAATLLYYIEQKPGREYEGILLEGFGKTRKKITQSYA